MFKLRNIDGHHSLKHLEIVIVITIKIITNTITIKKYWPPLDLELVAWPSWNTPCWRSACCLPCCWLACWSHWWWSWQRWSYGDWKWNLRYLASVVGLLLNSTTEVPWTNKLNKGWKFNYFFILCIYCYVAEMQLKMFHLLSCLTVLLLCGRLWRCCDSFWGRLSCPWRDTVPFRQREIPAHQEHGRYNRFSFSM